MISQTLRDARRYEDAMAQNITPLERPEFHLSPKVGWMNDPNGFSYYKNKFHLFYQYYPYDAQWGPMHWGHAVSEDLLRWEYLPAAIAPDMPYDYVGCFSGSAITLPDGKQLFMYTSVRREAQPGGGVRDIQTQSLAVGDGMDYEKDVRNPILTVEDMPENSSPFDFRDPKMWKCEDGTYRCVIVNDRADGTDGRILLYRSEDGFNWEFESVMLSNDGRFGKMWECPDFYPVGDKYVLMFSPMGGKERTSVYLVGNFDYDTGKFFYTTSGEIDWGFDYYAPQSFLAPDGRRILVGWANAWDWMPFWKDWGPTYQEGWCGFFNIPREAVLAEDNTLKFIPVKELQDLRKNKQEEADILIKEDEKKELRSGCVYETEMRINLKKSTADKIRLNLRMSQGKKTEILFDLKRAEAYFDRNNSDGWSKGVARCPLNLMGKEHLDIHIYSDKISLEIFSNDYQNNFSCNIYNVDDDQKNEMTAIGGDLMIESIRSWELEKTMK